MEIGGKEANTDGNVEGTEEVMDTAVEEVENDELNVVVTL